MKCYVEVQPTHRNSCVVVIWHMRKSRYNQMYSEIRITIETKNMNVVSTILTRYTLTHLSIMSKHKNICRGNCNHLIQEQQDMFEIEKCMCKPRINRRNPRTNDPSNAAGTVGETSIMPIPEAIRNSPPKISATPVQYV